MKGLIGKIGLVAGLMTAVVSLTVLSAETGSHGREQGAAKTVFAVRCYDEGARALEGMPGVLRIEKGFKFFQETDTVYYDPEKTSVDKMTKALKRAGTYRDTLQ